MTRIVFFLTLQMRFILVLFVQLNMMGQYVRCKCMGAKYGDFIACKDKLFFACLIQVKRSVHLVTYIINMVIQ
jgi:hypothetical protein